MTLNSNSTEPLNECVTDEELVLLTKIDYLNNKIKKDYIFLKNVDFLHV